jgi:signal transduction histidine kinase
MRERIVGAFILLALAILVTFSLARAYTANEVVTETENRKVQRSAALLAELAGSRQEAGQVLDEPYLARQLNLAERVDYVAPDGTRVTATAEGYRTAEQDTDVRHSVDVPGGGVMTLRRSQYVIDERVSDVLTSLVLMGMFLITVAGGLAFVAAWLLSRPFQELAGYAVALGRGRFDLEIPRYGVPEADTIGQALEHSAAELQDLVRREREFASNVSHQLRTPITALRLELEDLALWPDTPRPVAEELDRSLVQVDRLQTTVTDLLDLARTRRIGSLQDVDVVQLVRAVVERWRPAAGERHIALGVPGRVRAHQAPGPIEQVLDVLIDNALRHGRGTITVAVLDGEDHLEIRVGDQGTDRPADEVFHRHVGADGEGLGIGLTVAAEIAEAMGGRLVLADAHSTTFVLQLPVRRHADTHA